MSVRPNILNFMPPYLPKNQVRGDHIWTSNGPYGGYINDISTDGNGIYIGLLMNGVYRLQPATGWESRRTGIEYASVISILGKGPDTLFAGLENSGLWQTYNGGTIWTRNPTVPETVSINTIFRYDNSIFFAGTSKQGIYRSTNAGQTWYKVGSIIVDTVDARSFARDTTNIYLGTLGDGIYISPDFGLTWTPLPMSVDPWVWKIGIFYSGLNGYLYAGCEGGLYYRDVLGNWHSTTLNTSVSDFAILQDTIFVATFADGVWAGRIADSNFVPRNGGLLYKSINSIEIIGDTILVGTCGGFFYSTNHGLTWHERNQNLNANIIWDIAINPLNNQSIYVVSFGGLYKSYDNGESWIRYGTIPDYPLFTAIAINPQDSANILIGGVLNIYRTVDNGSNWVGFYIGTQAVSDIEFNPTNPIVVYAGTKRYFFASSNNGSTWFATDSLKGYNDIAVCWNAPETLYIATDLGIFKSNDGGMHFYPINSGLPNAPFSQINIDGYFPSLIYAGMKAAYAIEPTLYRSFNGGANWDSTGFPENSVARIKVIDNLPFYLLVSAQDSRIDFSLDGGVNWHGISPDLPGNYSPSFEFSPILHSAYLGNLSGIWTYTDTTKPTVFISAPDSFSPDGDSVNDWIKFYISASDSHGIYYWKLAIMHNNVTCGQVEGLGQPDSIIWDGFDSLGILQKNGLYEARVYCLDGFFNYDSARKFFYLEKKPMVSGKGTATFGPQGRKIAVDHNGGIHLVYTTYSPKEIFYTTSINGITWSEPLDLSNTKNAASSNPTIVIDNDNRVYVFWEEEIDGNTEIVYRRFSGVAWDTVVRLTNTSGPSVSPSVAVTLNNDLHLVWQERQTDEIYYRRYLFQNGTWTQAVNLSNTSGASRDPFILAHNQLYLFFCDNTNATPLNFEIRYRRYDGNNWLAESILTSDPGNSISPFATSDFSGTIHLFWTDSTPGNFDIYYKKFIPGSGWSADTNLTQNIANSTSPTVSIDSVNNIYLFWSEAGEIYQKVRDHQLGWLNAQNLSNTPQKSDYPSSSFNCDLVWTEGDSAPYRIIYFKSFISDTTGPKFAINSPETTYLYDTLAIAFTSDEELQGLPVAWLKDSVQDSIQLTITENAPLNYSGKVYVSNLIVGPGDVIVRGTDLHGNPGSADSTIYIDSLDTTPPRFTITAPDTCLLGDTLFITCAVNEQLSGLPVGWLKDSVQDSIQLTITENAPLNYSGKVYVSNLFVGPGDVIVRGTDLHGNPGSADSTIYIDSLDTTPPRFTITAPDTCLIGDTLFISFWVNEMLKEIPKAWLKDSLNDSIKFTVIEDSVRFYSAKVLVSGLSKGGGNFTIIATDMSNNTADSTITIWIGTKGELLPRDSCFAFPNPTRKNYVKFMFYLNQNAHLKIEIFTLSGRKIHTFLDSDYEGGRLYTETMSVENMGSDIYIFRAIATAGSQKAVVVKKFGVIK